MNNDRLKFRVWSKKSKRYTGNNASYSIDESGLLHVHIFGQHYELGNTEDFEVEQCTGLRDENGNLIYEGDIIKCEIDIERELSVVWDDGCFGVYVPTRDDFVKFYTLGNFTKHEWEVQNIEIIGNIHEQAE